MSKSFAYGLSTRFRGLFVELPWSFAVTAAIILPLAFFTWVEQKALLLNLLLYWTVLLSLLWFYKDCLVQAKLLDIGVDERAIHISKGGLKLRAYSWDQLRSIKMMQDVKKVNQRGQIPGKSSAGFALQFADGYEVLVFEQIQGYRQLIRFINQRSVPTQVV